MLSVFESNYFLMVEIMDKTIIFWFCSFYYCWYHHLQILQEFWFRYLFFPPHFYDHHLIFFNAPMNLDGLTFLCSTHLTIFYVFFNYLCFVSFIKLSTPLVPFKLFLFLPDIISTCFFTFPVPHELS